MRRSAGPCGGVVATAVQDLAQNEPTRSMKFGSCHHGLRHAHNAEAHAKQAVQWRRLASARPTAACTHQVLLTDHHGQPLQAHLHPDVHMQSALSCGVPDSISWVHLGYRAPCICLGGLSLAAPLCCRPIASSSIRCHSEAAHSSISNAYSSRPHGAASRCP